jgi:hypothetical protein
MVNYVRYIIVVLLPDHLNLWMACADAAFTWLGAARHASWACFLVTSGCMCDAFAPVVGGAAVCALQSHMTRPL